MRTLLSLFAVAGLLSSAACKKDEEKKADTPAPAPAATDTVAEKTPTPAPKKELEMTNKMAHCPSTVVGSATRVTDGEGVVVVTITAKEEAAVADIRKRANHLASLNDADASDVKHSGKGTGGGALGKCPIAVGHGVIAAEDMEGGAKITITPREDENLAVLSKLAKDRVLGLSATPTPAKSHSHGSGNGGGQHAGHGTGDGK